MKEKKPQEGKMLSLQVSLKKKNQMGGWATWVVPLQINRKGREKEPSHGLLEQGEEK